MHHLPFLSRLMGTLLAAAVLLTSTLTASDVFTNVPKAADEDYQVLYELDLPANAGFQNGTAVPYHTDRSGNVPEFDRVAYYLELTNAHGTQWIYASMDAFTADPAKLGLPHNIDNPIVHQRTVERMNVASNVPGIVTGTFIDTGNIEMWPSNYNTPNDNGVFAADSDRFDWGDGDGEIVAGYGSFQIHNSVARQTLLAYNRWGVDDGLPDDLGIGNQPTGNSDWTFAGNAGDFTARKLVILVRPRTSDVTFTQLPRNRQLYSRDPATNRATVPISGHESFGGFDRIVLRVMRDGLLHDEFEQLLHYQNESAPFSFAPVIEAELARYDFHLFLEKNGQLQTIDRIADVVAGDAFLFYGQSNAEAKSYDGKRSANEYASEWLLSFGQNGDAGIQTENILYWVEAEGDGDRRSPGAIGQWAMVLGRKIIDNHQIPVAILNGSRAGYSLFQLRKDRSDPDNLYNRGGVIRTYNRLRYRAIQAGVATTARALFFYQGEAEGHDAQLHADGFARMREDWDVDYPGIERFYITQVRPGCEVSADSVALRDAQRRFGDLYSKTSIMASNGLIKHDGCHYRFGQGYEDLGLIHYRQVARDLYGAPDDPNIEALNPAYAAFTDENRTAIRLVLRNEGATVVFPVEALADFFLAGTSATITGRTVSGSTVFFQLSEPAAASSVLEYRSHLGDGAWVTNAHGVGLLSFAEPVREYQPPEGFAAWALDLPPNERGELDDPGGFGIPNILRYAFGMNAGDPKTGQLPTPGLATVIVEGEPRHRLTLTLTRRTDDPTLTYKIEASDDLTNWTAIHPTEQILVPDNGATETLLLTDTEAESDRRFLRTKVLWPAPASGSD